MEKETLVDRFNAIRMPPVIHGAPPDVVHDFNEFLEGRMLCVVIHHPTGKVSLLFGNPLPPEFFARYAR